MNENVRGLGRVFQRTYKDKKTGERKKLNTWWIEFHHNGKQIRKPSGSTKKSEAMKLLRNQLDASTNGSLVVGRGERLRFDDMAEMLRRDYRINQRRSLDRAEYASSGLKAQLGNSRALDISDEDLNAYVDLRLETDRISNACVHYEIAVLKRMYRLAPLGTNRKRGFRVYFSLFLVFLLCGFWHGAAWTHMAWGVYNGMLLVIEMALKNRSRFETSGIADNVMTGWVLFRSADLKSALGFRGSGRTYVSTKLTIEYEIKVPVKAA